jgi:hypothetical protein
VGDPQLDASAVHAVEGVNAAVQPTVDVIAKDMHAKEMVRIDQQANKALIDYSLAYQRRMKDLEVQYADNPTAYPEAVGALGTELQTEYNNAIPDERVKARFGEAANPVIRQYSLNAFNWADAKDEENATIANRDSLATAAVVVGQETTIDGYKASLGSMATIAYSDPRMTPANQAKQLESYSVTAKDNFMRVNAINRGGEFETELNKGMYDKVTYVDDNGKSHVITLDEKEKQAYIKLAQDADANRRSMESRKQLLASEGQARDLYFKYTRNEIDLEPVVAYTEAVRRDPNAPKVVKDNADELETYARTIHRTKEGVVNPWTESTLTSRAQTLHAAIKKGKNKPEKFFEDVIQLNTDIMHAINSGEIEGRRGTVLLHQVSPWLAQAIEKGPKVGWFDPIGQGYDVLKAKVGNLMGVSETVRIETQNRAYTNFLQLKTDAEEKNPGIEITSKQYKEMAETAFKSATDVVYPRTVAVDESVNAWATKSGGVQAVQTNDVPAELTGTRKLTKSKYPIGVTKTDANGAVWRKTGEKTWTEVEK